MNFYVSLVLLLGTTEAANILGLGLLPSVSHQVVFQPIWEELSRRGHQVTVITPNPINNPELNNLTEIDVSFIYNLPTEAEEKKAEVMLGKHVSARKILKFLITFSNIIAELILSNGKVSELLNGNNRFDVILMEYYSPIFYGLSSKYRAPVIALSSLGGTFNIHDAVGNPSHPAFFPDFHSPAPNGQLSLSQRIESTLLAMWYRYYYNYVHLPSSHEIAMKYFGKDIPYIGDLEKNVSLFFYNENYLIYPPRPSVPTAIQLGMMHIKPVKPLPNDLEELLDEAEEGVVYFSLGSNVKSVNIAPQLRSTIIEALKVLPYKVLWKWESDNLPGKPSNVITRKWLPQQDLLAHKNIKAFVTQAGLQSTEEAISRGVPLVAMPFFADQFTDAQRIVDLGIGVQVDQRTVTKEELRKAILEVAENQKYRQKIKEVRDLINDQPMTGLERAVWWTEYVIRHNGTEHLRSPMADAFWYQYFFLDVIAVTVVFPSTLAWILLKIFVPKLRKIINFNPIRHSKRD